MGGEDRRTGGTSHFRAGLGGRNGTSALPGLGGPGAATEAPRVFPLPVRPLAPSYWTGPFFPFFLHSSTWRGVPTCLFPSTTSSSSSRHRAHAGG